MKTDSVDARTLAELLRADLLPEAYAAPRALRDLLRQRAVLTNMRSGLKNRVHALLARHGIQHHHADLFGRAGREFLEQLELRREPRRRLEALMRLIADVDHEVGDLSSEIDERAWEDPRVRVLSQSTASGPTPRC